MGENQLEAGENYEKLYKDYKEIQQQLEQRQQELHETTRQLRITQTVVTELEDENRVLLTQFEEQKTKYEQTIQENKDQFAEAKIDYSQQINNLEKKLDDKNVELNRLKARLEAIEAENVEKNTDNDHVVEQDEQTDERLTLKIYELEELYEKCQKKNQQLETINAALKSEIEDLKDCINSKKSELDEVNQMFESLQESYALTKSELETVKTKPDMGKQGNSLFAEVNDKRIQLQQNMKILKQRLIEMKQERQGILQQITLLRNENANLITKHKDELNQIVGDENEILQSHKKQIETLKQLIQKYKIDLKEARSLKADKTDPIANFQYYDKLVESKNKEIEELREQLMVNRYDHTRLRQELAKSIRSITEMEKVVNQLQNDIQVLQLKNEHSLIQQHEQTLSCDYTLVDKTVNDVELNATTNETIPHFPSRKVTFGETTISEFN